MTAVETPKKGTIEYDRIKLEERRAKLIDRAKKAKERAESNMKLATAALDKCNADLKALGVTE